MMPVGSASRAALPPLVLPGSTEAARRRAMPPTRSAKARAAAGSVEPDGLGPAPAARGRARSAPAWRGVTQARPGLLRGIAWLAGEIAVPTTGARSDRPRRRAGASCRPEAERVGEAPLEHDRRRAARGALGLHRLVDRAGGTQPGERQPVRCRRRCVDDRGRDGLVAFGDPGQRRDRACVGFGGHARQHVRAVGGIERSLPRVARGRADLEAPGRSSPPPRRPAGSSGRSRAARADAGEGQPDQRRGHGSSATVEGKRDRARAPQLGLVGHQPVAERDRPDPPRRRRARRG